MQLRVTCDFGHGTAVLCRTRDLSEAGTFLELDLDSVEADVGDTVTLTLMDAERGEVVDAVGEVTRRIEGKSGQPGGLGVHVIDPPEGWSLLVTRLGARSRASTTPPPRRLRVLVVGDAERRRGAMALYVASGWDVRFATDLPGAREALQGFRIDAAVAEHHLDDPRWPRLLEEVRRQQPTAKRLVRAPLGGELPPPPGGPDDLVHCVIDQEEGLDAFLAIIAS